jgi:hypothetical protein
MPCPTRAGVKLTRSAGALAFFLGGTTRRALCPKSPLVLSPPRTHTKHTTSPNTTAARRLLRGGNGGWDGGVGTEDIQSENDAIAGIDNAVNNDNFGATYSAAEGGYRE